MTAPPSKLTRFFTIVNRLISLVVLLALLALGASMVHTAWLRMPEQEPGSVKVKVEDATKATSSAVALSFSKPESVTSADVEIVELLAGNEAGGGYGSRDSSEVRNALFVSNAGKPARWLFKDHKNKVPTLQQLKYVPPGQDAEHTAAIYVEFIAPQSTSENLTVALAKPDGSGIRSVLPDVTRVLSYQLADTRTLTVLFQRGAVLRQASISLDDFTVISERQIEKLPAAL